MTRVTLVEVVDDVHGVGHLVRDGMFRLPMCILQGANETTLRPRHGGRGLSGLSCLWCMAILVRARVSLSSQLRPLHGEG